MGHAFTGLRNSGWYKLYRDVCMHTRVYLNIFVSSSSMFNARNCYDDSVANSFIYLRRFLIKRILEVVVGCQVVMSLFQQWMVPCVKNSLVPFSVSVSFTFSQSFRVKSSLYNDEKISLRPVNHPSLDPLRIS